MASHPKELWRSTFILNGHSAHVEEAKAHIARISGEFDMDAEVVVTKRGDDISSLAARALSERRQPIVAGGGDGTVSAVARGAPAEAAYDFEWKTASGNAAKLFWTENRR